MSRTTGCWRPGNEGLRTGTLAPWVSHIAACLASVGHDVTGLDSNSRIVEKLQTAVPPVSEPGLDDLIREGINAGRLRFTTNAKIAISSAQVLWVTYDTPVDENDHADVEFVFQEVVKLLLFLGNDTIVLVSSQLPVGSIKRFEDISAEKYPEKNIRFAYSPENLRLGKSSGCFFASRQGNRWSKASGRSRNLK